MFATVARLWRSRGGIGRKTHAAELERMAAEGRERERRWLAALACHWRDTSSRPHRCRRPRLEQLTCLHHLLRPRGVDTPYSVCPGGLEAGSGGGMSRLPASSALRCTDWFLSLSRSTLPRQARRAPAWWGINIHFRLALAGELLAYPSHTSTTSGHSACAAAAAVPNTSTFVRHAIA